MQMTAKHGANGKESGTVYMFNYIHPEHLSSDNWYFKGTICKELSMEVNVLLKDMSMVSAVLRTSNKCCDLLNLEINLCTYHMIAEVMATPCTSCRSYGE